MTTLRILITGSRHYSDIKRVDVIFRNVMKRFENDEYVLISGNARGADALCEEVAEKLGWKVERFPADWNKYGKRAGGIRNQLMVDSGADLCLAFPLDNSIGTWDCVRRAKKAGILTKVFQ